MRYALMLAVLVFAGCELANPTGVAQHPNEILIEGLSHCFAGHHRIESLDVVFFEEARPYQDSFVAGAAWPGGGWVEYYGPWVRGEVWEVSRTDLTAVAAHEVCHVTGIWDEAETSLCAEKAVRESGC